MIPITLTIEGLYSYQQKVIIDFESLSVAGLFGIFGSVGSGKSSILEAISFVLYESSERLDAKDKRSYNMLNLKSNAAYISFEFLNFENKKYKFTAAWKRKKKFHEIESLSRNAYEWNGEDWLPLENNNAVPIIGLSYENFKRTTIIPQGKFKEFLELKGKDRSHMMKEIFSLEQFDLSAKVAYAQSKNNATLHELEGKLSTYELVTHDELARIKAEKEQQQLEQKECEEKLAQAETYYKKEEQYYQKHLEYNAACNKYEQILHEETTIKQRKSLLQNYIVAQQIFSNDLERLHILKKQQTSGLEKQQAAISTQQQQALLLQEASNESAQSKKDYDGIEQKHALIKQLENLIAINISKETLHNNLANFEKGNQLCVEVEERIKQLHETQSKLHNEKLKFQSSKISTQELLNIQDVVQQIQNARNLVALQQKECDAASATLESLKAMLLYNDNKDWRVEISKKRSSIEQHLQTLKTTKEKASIHQHLLELAQTLNNGDPCPVCGSLEHPNPASNVTIEAISLANDIKQHELQLQELFKKEIELSNIEKQYQQIIKDNTSLTEALHKQQEHLQTIEHQYAYAMPYVLDQDKLIALKKEQANIEKALHDLDIQLVAVQNKINNENDTAKKYNERLQILEIAIAKEREKITILSNAVDPTTVLLYESFDNAKLQARMDAEKISVQQIIEVHNLANEKHQRIQISYENAVHNLKYIANELVHIKDAIEALNQDLELKLKASPFESIDTAVSILNNNIDINAEQAFIQKIETQKQLLEHQLQQYEPEVVQYNKDLTYINALKTELQSIKIVHTKLTEQVAVLLSQEELLTQQLIIKEQLIKEQETIQHRASNLQILKNLFMGAGFVNYISTIYLRKLCDIANSRFHRLTKNQLSLTINENNDFEVIDALNNGYARSVKTLSGGQLFQASLCLALALAESVTTKHTLEKSFFFIDEGFGTLDAVSLEIVIETLQNLRKENRIVGVISHVDALKEAMPKYITIEKDDHMGSAIVYS